MKFQGRTNPNSTPSTKLILRHLRDSFQPQSYVEICTATGLGYWTVRKICLALVPSGDVIKSMEGRSPVFTIPVLSATSVIEAATDKTVRS